MKNLVLATAALMLGAAASTGCGRAVPVAVSMKAPQEAPAAHAAQNAHAQTSSTVAPLLAFDIVNFALGSSASQRIGFGLLSSGAEPDSSPLIRRLMAAEVAQPSSWVVPLPGNQIAYFDGPSAEGQPWVLREVDLRTLHERDLATSDEPPVRLSASEGLSAQSGGAPTFAWVTQKGQLWELDLSAQTPSRLLVEKGVSRAHWLAGWGWVAASFGASGTSIGKIHFVAPSDQSVARPHDLDGDDFALGSDANRWAVAFHALKSRNGATTGAIKVTRDGGATWANFAENVKGAYEPAWGKGGLAFWVDTSMGPELRFVATDATGAFTGTEQRVTRLAFPDGMKPSQADGWVCPAWAGNDLFFASARRGEQGLRFALFRARHTAGDQWQVEELTGASSADDEPGDRVCPRIEREESGS